MHYMHKLANKTYFNVQFLYSLKKLENHRFSDVFKGCKNGKVAQNGLIRNITSYLKEILWLLVENMILQKLY